MYTYLLVIAWQLLTTTGAQACRCISQAGITLASTRTDTTISGRL